METIKEILMRRDNMTAIEADEELHGMRERVAAGEDPEEVLYDIGLEPDYIFELL